MTRPSATCELFVNGVRVPDTAVDLVDAHPTALDGLSLTWGRDGQNEQPGTATCSFKILDRFAESDFLDRLHVGSPVALWAQGEVGSSGGAEFGPTTFDNGSLIGWADGAPPVRSTTLVAGSFAVESESLSYTPDPTLPTFAFFAVPPRAFSPAGQLPNAWDDIPRARIGETWRISARVKMRAGVIFRLYFQGYASPYENPTFGNAFPIATPVTATGGWQTVSFDYLITQFFNSATSNWLAFMLSAQTLVQGTRWQDQTTTWAAETRTWEDQSFDSRAWVDDLAIFPPRQTSRRVLAFSGSVTDVVATPFGDGDTLELAVTAADLASDLGNRVIGDNPWPVQTVAVRANRIAQLAGITSSPRVRIDTPLDALQLSYRDVDAQAAYALLQDVAQSAGGVLWAATHAVTGQYLYIEDPSQRVSLRELTLSGATIVIVGATEDVTLLSACDLLEEPISWRQDTADVSTVVAVTWLEQGVDTEGQPTTTERTETVTDTAATTTYGTRRLSISTELINSSDAIALANRALATARAVPWRIDGLTLDSDAGPDHLDTVDDVSRQVALLNLLDGTTRMGLAITLVDMPAYAPRGSISDVYVEGGRYAYEDGAWTLALSATPSSGQGDSATWGDLDPTWMWSQWQSSLVWQDLYGVAA